jgi:flagellar biosynthetic protein FliO
MHDRARLAEPGGRHLGVPHELSSLHPSPPRMGGGRRLESGRRSGPKSASLQLILLLVFAATSLFAADTQNKTTPSAVTSSTESASVESEQIGAALAVEKASRPVQLAEAVPGGGEFPLFRTLGGLGLVVSFILGGFVVVRRMAPQYFKGGAPDRVLRVIETLPMGDKRSIALVQVGGRRYLVGNTTHQINILSELGAPPDDAGVVEPLAATSAMDSGSPKGKVSNFRNLYEHEKSGRTGGYENRPIPAELRAKMRRLRESLEG